MNAADPGLGLPMKEMDLQRFRGDLICWGRTHFRGYPWRQTRDPYRLLIAEVLLHRTRADQAATLYGRVTSRYPSICDVAVADDAELRELMKPAGLTWRTELLHRTAQTICWKYDGVIPHSRELLEGLPGIGPYIAAALRCFAFGEPDALLDTNTVRIAGRLFGVVVTDASRRSRRFRALLEFLTDPADPRGFNFALLDLGALVCVSGVPRCEICPVRTYCEYGMRRVVSGGGPGIA